MFFKILRLKIVEENIDNFIVVIKDVIVSLVKLKEVCGLDGYIFDLEGELSRWVIESMFKINIIVYVILFFIYMIDIFLLGRGSVNKGYLII